MRSIFKVAITFNSYIEVLYRISLGKKRKVKIYLLARN